MSLRRLVLGLTMIGVLSWGGAALAAGPVGEDGSIPVDITCTVASVAFGWASPTTDIAAFPTNSGEKVTWALGTINMSTAYNTHATTVEVMTIKNWGSTTISITIATAASTPAGWTNAAAIDADKYKLEWDTDSGVSYTAITTNAVVNAAAASGWSSDFDLQITMPSSTTLTGGVTIPVTLTASSD